MIPFIKPYYDEDDFNAVKEVLQSGWVAQGPKVEEFETEVAKYLGCRNVISTTNCTTALTLALKALYIGPGDEVIVPDFTFPATIIAVTNVGATPILVDVTYFDYNINVEKIEEKITRKTKAIIPVHLFGLSALMPAIMAIAKEYHLYVIEDAACSLGANNYENHSFDGQKLGTIGDIGCFSLHASKGVATGEGGLLSTNNDSIAYRLRRLSTFGDERAYRRSKSKEPFYFDSVSGNYKMSDITAALGLSQLKKIDKLIEWRRKIAAEWNDIISNDLFLRENILIKPLMIPNHIYQSYVALCKEGTRQKVMDYFAAKGFATGIGTHACHVYPSLFKDKLNLIDFPISDDLFHNAISLPRYYGLSPLKEWR